MQATESAIRTPYEDLVQRERVHGSLYTDEQIFAEELARIWYTTWVFVGHLSEVLQPNDYVPEEHRSAGSHHDAGPRR